MLQIPKVHECRSKSKVVNMLEIKNQREIYLLICSRQNNVRYFTFRTPNIFSVTSVEGVKKKGHKFCTANETLGWRTNHLPLSHCSIREVYIHPITSLQKRKHFKPTETTQKISHALVSTETSHRYHDTENCNHDEMTRQAPVTPERH